MGIYQEALDIKEEIIQDRRFLHQNPELGFDLPITLDFVEKKLKEMGYSPVRLGGGIVAEAGNEGGKCILLRADMDALPVEEQTDVPFKATNGKMHACGHDCHTANLLGAARLIKKHEDELCGKVRLMFQPAEETMEGARSMVEAGVCQGVDAAVGMHVFTNLDTPAGAVTLRGKNARMAAVDWFEIIIKGTGCHGAEPDQGVDPLNVMVHIHLALQTLNARELDPTDNLVVTIGQMHGGTTSNVIPGEAFMSGTIRTLKNETRARVKARMCDIVEGIAASFNAEAYVVYGAGCPVLTENAGVYDQVKELLGDLEGVAVIDLDETGKAEVAMGSEDFAYVANEVPSVFLSLSAGNTKEGYCYPLHHPKAMMDEEALASGAAVYAQVAIQWLKMNK